LDQQIRISTVDLSQPGPVDKPAPAVRDRLPNRRASQNIALERDNLNYQITAGYYLDGRVGEIFLNADRGDSLLDVLTSDAAILASLALQYGCPLTDIVHALKRNSRGEAASPIGAALDLIQ
jgi:ribonucleoside-diphosphate reductase alpha chain